MAETEIVWQGSGGGEYSATWNGVQLAVSASFGEGHWIVVRGTSRRGGVSATVAEARDDAIAAARALAAARNDLPHIYNVAASPERAGAVEAVTTAVQMTGIPVPHLFAVFPKCKWSRSDAWFKIHKRDKDQIWRKQHTATHWGWYAYLGDRRNPKDPEKVDSDEKYES